MANSISRLNFAYYKNLYKFIYVGENQKQFDIFKINQNRF